MCIIILKHSGMSNLKNIGSPIFMPLFLACTTTNIGRKWLQDHYSVLQPFYQKFNEINDIKHNLQTDEVHMKILKKKIKLFNNFMVKLQHGENIIGKSSDVMESLGEESNNKNFLRETEERIGFHGLKKSKKRPKIKIVKKEIVEELHLKNITPDKQISDKDLKKTDNAVVTENDLNEKEQAEENHEKESITTEKSNNKPSKNSSYDPSDLFGLLATSRSTESSDESDVGNQKTRTRVLTDSEKEENRLKQIPMSMSTIFCITDNNSSGYPGKNDYDYKPSAGPKQHLTRKASDENIEPVTKDLSPALSYLQSVFDDFAAKHRKVWNYERVNNYPDYKTPKNEDEAVQLLKLKIVLSQLEFYYLNVLTEEWNQLINVIRNKVWYSEEASNDVISKVQELLLKREAHIVEKLRKIEEEEIKNKYLERRSLQNEKFSCQRIVGDIHLILDKPPDIEYFSFNWLKNEYLRSGENEFFLGQKIPSSSNALGKTSSQPKLFEVDKRDLGMDLSQGSSGVGLELNTIFFNKGYKSDSYSEIVSIGSKTGSSQSIPTPRNDDERREPYNLWNRASDNPLEKLLKAVREPKETSLRSSARFCCWANEINNLKKMIKNSHVQYGEILLPNPLKSGKILLPYGETGYFGSVEMGLDQKGNPMAVKHVKKSFPTSIDILSGIMIRLRKVNNKYLLPYYMSEGFEPIIATPLMNFNLGQYILHLKTNCSLDFKAPELIKEVYSQFSISFKLSPLWYLKYFDI